MFKIVCLLLIGTSWFAFAFSNKEYYVKKRCYQTNRTLVDGMDLPREVLRHSTDPHESSVLIKIAGRGWLTHAIMYHMFRILLEEFLGYTNVVLHEASFHRATSLQFGDLACTNDKIECSHGHDKRFSYDVEIESWRMYDVEDPHYKNWVRIKKSVLDAGFIGYWGTSGIYFTPRRVDSELMRGYAFYAMHRSTAVMETFPRNGSLDLMRVWGDRWRNDPSFCGEDWNNENPLNEGQWCVNSRYVPPMCNVSGVECNEMYKLNTIYDKGRVEQMIKNNGLLYTVAYVTPNFGRLIKGFSKQSHRPALFYWWEPDPLIIAADAVRVAFPYTQCTGEEAATTTPDGPISCDFLKKRLTKATSTPFPDRAPIANYVLEKMQVTPTELEWTMARHVDADPADGSDSFDAACAFIQRHEQRVLEWLPLCEADAFFDMKELICVKSCPPTEVPVGDICKPCRYGQEPYWSTRGSRPVCRDCLPGYYNPFSNRSSCSHCPAGRSQPRPGQTSCLTCPEGRFSPPPEGQAGNVRCFQCAAGRYQPSEMQDLCIACESGRFSMPGAPECLSCESGSFSDAEGASECQVCYRGRAQNNRGSTSCVACRAGRYQGELGQVRCELCPDTLTTGLDGAERIDQCICPEGEYLVANANASMSRCLNCIEGLSCPGTDPPWSLSGFMFQPTGARDPPEHISVYRCRSSKLCPGTSQLMSKDMRHLFPGRWEHICGGGHQGIACARCPDGFYEDRDTEDYACAACQSSDTFWKSLMLILVSPLVALFFYYNFNKRQDPIAQDCRKPPTSIRERFSAAMEASRETDAPITIKSSNGFRSEWDKLITFSESEHIALQNRTSGAPNMLSRIKPPTIFTRLWNSTAAFVKEVGYVVRDCLDTLLQFAQVVVVLDSMVTWLTADHSLSIHIKELIRPIRFVNLHLEDVLHLLSLPDQCVFSDFFDRFAFNMMLPVCWGATFVINLILYVLVGVPIQRSLGSHFPDNPMISFVSNLQMTGDRTLNSIGAQTLLLFIGISSTAFSLFVCDPNPSGDATIRRYPDVICFSDEWNSVLWMGICALLVYTIGFIVFVVFIVFSSPKYANKAGFRARYFFIFNKLKPEAYWWRIVVISKALVLHILVTIFTNTIQFLMVLLTVLHVIALSMVFYFKPWNDPVLTIIDTTCQMSIILLVSCISFHLDFQTTQYNVFALIGTMEVIALKLPLAITFVCTAIPFHRFLTKERRKQEHVAFSQRFRDASLLITRHTTEELQEFVTKLNEYEKETLDIGLDMVYARMYKIQPPQRWRWRLVKDADRFEMRTSSTSYSMLVDAIRAGRGNDLQSLEEVSLVHHFLEVASQTYVNSHGQLPSSEKLFRFLDTQERGTLSRLEFVFAVLQVAPCMILEKEALLLYNIMTSKSELSQSDFCAALLGITYWKGLLQSDTPCKDFEIREHETARRHLRLACMLAGSQKADSVSAEMLRLTRTKSLKRLQTFTRGWLKDKVRRGPVMERNQVVDVVAVSDRSADQVLNLQGVAQVICPQFSQPKPADELLDLQEVAQVIAPPASTRTPTLGFLGQKCALPDREEVGGSQEVDALPFRQEIGKSDDALTESYLFQDAVDKLQKCADDQNAMEQQIENKSSVCLDANSNALRSL